MERISARALVRRCSWIDFDKTAVGAGERKGEGGGNIFVGISLSGAVEPTVKDCSMSVSSGRALDIDFFSLLIVGTTIVGSGIIGDDSRGAGRVEEGLECNVVKVGAGDSPRSAKNAATSSTRFASIAASRLA